MAGDKPDIRPFANAIERLKEGLADYERNTRYELVRDGLIQRFEFTYEIAWKTLARYLEHVSPNGDDIRRMSFPTLIRTANEHGLLRGDWSAWDEFRTMRNKTSHAYEEAAAVEVVKGIPKFLEEAAWLRDKLREKLA